MDKVFDTQEPLELWLQQLKVCQHFFCALWCHQNLENLAQILPNHFIIKIFKFYCLKNKESSFKKTKKPLICLHF